MSKITKKAKNARKQDDWERLMQVTSHTEEPLQTTLNGDGRGNSPNNNSPAPGEWMEHCTEFEQPKPPVIKKMKVENSTLADEYIKTWKQKFSEAKKKEGEQRKRCMTRVADQLSDLIRKEEAEAKALEEQERHRLQLGAAVHKQNQQTIQGNKQKLQLIKQTVAAYEKQWSENVAAEEKENKSLEKQLGEETRALQQTLEQDSRRRTAEAVKKAIAMFDD